MLSMMWRSGGHLRGGRFSVLVARARRLRVARAGDAELGPYDRKLGRGMTLGDAGIELLARLDDADAGEATEPAMAKALDRRRHAQQQARIGGRHEERAG